MQEYICKCGKTFQKSCSAETTGYSLYGYSAEHECFGCPYIVKEHDYKTDEVTGYKCIASQQINYISRCKIETEDGNYSACYIYTLDLSFAKRIINRLNDLEGSGEGNVFPAEWRTADFGRCWGVDNCYGLAIIPLYFQKNKKGTEARKEIKSRYFDEFGYRKYTPKGGEKNYVLNFIQTEKDYRRILLKKEDDNMGKIDLVAMKNARKAAEDMIDDNTPDELVKAHSEGGWKSQKETVIQIQVTRLQPFVDKDGNSQPFKLSESRVEQIAESAKDIGIITPLVVRPKGDTYEIISGHHRLEAAKSISLLTVPCVIKDYTDEEMYRALSESNIQRGKILPSEYGKIFAKYMSLRQDEETSCSEIAKKFNVSKKTIHRYIAVYNLSEDLQTLVDECIISIGAVEYIKNFTETVQNALYEALTQSGKKLSLAFAMRLKELVDVSGDDVTANDIAEMFDIGIKKPEKKKYSNKVYGSITEKYKLDISEKELDDITEKLLEEYFSSKA